MAQKSIALSDKPVTLSARIQDYIQLTKFRLSSLVVFSAAMGYIIAEGAGFQWSTLLLLMLGGFLVTGSSNAFNQVIERDLDKLMDRTANRPLPAGRMSVPEALVASVLMGVSGVLILWLGINALCGILSLVSLVIYTTIYTPAKRVTPFAVLIGAFPGAFPPLLGWVAGKGEIGLEALILYALQFIWQFPHFWAIAWRPASACCPDPTGATVPQRFRPWCTRSVWYPWLFCHWHFTSPVGSPPCCWQPVESTFPCRQSASIVRSKSKTHRNSCSDPSSTYRLCS